MIVNQEIIQHTVIVKGQINGIDNDTLVRDALANKNNRTSNDPANTLNEDSLMPMSEEFQEVITGIRQDYELLAQTSTLSLAAYWAHVQEYNQSSNIHDHFGVDLSGCYYPDENSNSASIVFVWDVPQTKTEESSVYTPEQGDFLLFPSWLKHYVTRNSNREPRVSISFNFNVIQCDIDNQTIVVPQSHRPKKVF